LGFGDSGSDRYNPGFSTGQNLTRVVVESLRQRRERIPVRRAKPTLEEFLAAAKRVSAALDRPIPDHGDFLYDEHGLPK